MTESCNITFTEYSKCRSVMHIDDHRHFIIDNAGRDAINAFLSSGDEKDKAALYNYLASKEKEQQLFCGLQDFQYKKTIIPKSVMNVITKPFHLLFNKWVFSLLFPAIVAVGIFLFFISKIIFITQKFSIGVSWLMILLMAVFHELGHASACKSNGADVSEVGIGISSFRPVMYANVSGAWYLPKNQRIVVNLGGIYFQMIYAILFGYLSLYYQDTSMFYACKIIFISAFFQFFPLFRSDGYWIISDVLEEPNLYKKSKSILSRQLSKHRKRMNAKEIKMLAYYVILEVFVLCSLVWMIYRYYHYIITLPSFLYHEIMLLFQWRICEMLVIDIKYVWSALLLMVVIYYFSGILIKTICPKGAGQMAK